jgi:hypothetical protein
MNTLASNFKKLLIAILICLAAPKVDASVWDGDAGVIAGAMEQIALLKQNLAELTDTKKAIESIRDLESKDNPMYHIYKSGQNLSQIADDIDSMESDIKGFIADPYGLMTIKRDIAEIESGMQKAKDSKDVGQIRAYGRQLTKLKRIEWLKKRNKEALEERPDATNAENQAKATNSILSIEATLNSVISERAKQDSNTLEAAQNHKDDLIRGYQGLK